MNDQKPEVKYPVGIQSFEKLRAGNFLYVDKTALLYKLVKNDGYYFLSRPRRFGKSLLISTLEAYFKGQRELFKGLALDSLADDWTPHPVLHLDLNNGNYTSPDGVNERFLNSLDQWEQEYGQLVNNQHLLSASIRFGNVIKSAYEHTGKKVVILVDEYDKPLLAAIGNPELEEIYRAQLKAFYSNLKSMDAYIRVGVLTGVARFSKVSIFSDLNNLRDISFLDEYAAMCGITTEELGRYFHLGIESLAAKQGLFSDDVRDMLRSNYDGYKFSAQSPDIYNPFALMSVFANMKISTYWSDVATPEFLTRLLKSGDWNLTALAPVRIEARRLETAGIGSGNPTPALYQAGYLTIKDYDSEFNEYLLDYPNQEVRKSLWEDLVPAYLYPESNQGNFTIKEFIHEIREGAAAAFMKRMETLIAGVPYSDKGSAEAHFQNAVYLLFNLMGFYCKMEERTSTGRIDIRLVTDRYIYILEFKIDASSQAAIEQIEEKRYWLPYQMDGKQIILIGANFDTKTRRLSDDPVIKLV